ncbi:MAG: T9SS type A sorting domain-containing protein [Pseudoflavonifractor sp.]|nr:T9SS type A sorting domain-containing protein [Pseudoflavonifractor sp.]
MSFTAKSTSVDDITSASVIGYVSSTALNNSSQSWSSTGLSLTGASGTWSRNFYVNSADNKNFFRLKINGKEYGHTGTSTNAVTLTDNSWTSVAEQSNDYCFAVSDTSKEYTISIRKKSDGSCYEVMASPVEDAETISTVHFKGSNGTSYQLDATGGNYSHTINPALTADYWFEVVTSKGIRSYYYVTNGPVDTNNKQYTVAKDTSSSNNFKFDSDKVEAVTQVIANVSGLAITTAQFAITPKTVSATKYYLHTNMTSEGSGDTWTNDNLEMTLKSVTLYEITGVNYVHTGTAGYMVKAVNGSETDYWKGSADFKMSDSDETKDITLSTSGGNQNCELPVGTYTFTFDSSNGKFTATREDYVAPAETVTAISLNYGGNNNSNPLYNNPASFTKSADGNWTLASTAVTAGDGNPYYLSVTTNKSSYRYMVDGASDAKYYIKSAQSYNVKSDSNTGHAFVFTGGTGFDFTSGSVTGTVTIGSDGLPSTMTFRNYTGSNPVVGSNWVVAGTWNNFSKTASPMTDEGNGIYTLTLTLNGSGVMFLYNTTTNKQWSDKDTDFDGTAVKNRTLYQYTNETSASKDNITYSSLKSGEYKITWNSSTSKFSIASTAAERQIVVNMPLKKSDFANGKKHYFVVGTRMGAWRLQPEWELKANSDGSYSLPNRLMYSGYFMIAEVDSYDNYTKHIYKAYSCHDDGYSTNYIQKGNRSEVTLSQVNPNTAATTLGSGYWTSFRYGSNDGTTREQFGSGNGDIKKKAIRFVGNGVEPEKSDQIWTCLPELVDIKVSMNNGHPSKVGFTYNNNNNNNAVNEALTFTISGSAFRNFELDPENTDYTTPRLANGSGVTELGWQEGWIQYDANSEPYVDAYGEFLYQTVWQKSWLNAHPTRFVNKRGFEFTGDNLTFTYDADRTAKRSSNTFSNAIDYTTSGQSTTTVNINNKMCYVTEDVWIRGAFKIWTGWGGSSQFNQGCGDGTAALWYGRNGGHAVADHDRVVYGTPDNNMQYFKTHNNVGAADFAIGVDYNSSTGVATGVANDGGTTGNLGDDDGTLVFLKRIELWWDPVNGFDNSVLYFEKELGAPVILIDRMSKTTLGYNYKIQDANADDIVAEAKIELLKVTTDDEGNETRTVAGTVWTSNEQKAATEFYNYLDDVTFDEWNNELEPGDYRMKISVRYLNNTEFKTNVSNKVTIRQYVNPVALKLSQPKDAQGRLTFNLKIDSEALNIALDNDEEAPATLSYYSVTVPEYLDEDEEVEFFTAIETENGVTINDENEFNVEITENGEKKNVTVTAMQYNNDGTVSLNIKPLGRDKKYRMPSITLKNVVPGKEHLVSVKMYGNDGDAQPWDDIFVSEGSAKIILTAPAATIDRPDVTLKNEEIDWNDHFEEVPVIHARQNVRHGHVYEHETADAGETYMAVETFGGEGYGKNLTMANYFNVNMNIPALNVADEVLDNWDVKLNFNIERFHYDGTTTRAAETYVYNVPASGSTINNSETNHEVDIKYLPLNIEKSKLSDLYDGDDVKALINGSNGADDDPVYDSPLATKYKVTVLTSYKRKWVSSSETDVDVEGGSQTAELYDPAKVGDLVAYDANFKHPHGIQLHERSGAKWYDAFNVISVGGEGDAKKHKASGVDGTPVHSFGIFITNGTVTQWYDRNDSQHKMYPGGHVLNTANGSPNGYASKYQVLSTLPSTAHFGETVAAMGDNAAIPVLIGNIANVTKPRYDSADPFYSVAADAGLTGNATTDVKGDVLKQKAADIKGYLFTSYPLLQTPRNKSHVYAEVTITDDSKSAEATLVANHPMAVNARRMAAATRALDHVDPTDPALLTLELPAEIGGNAGEITTEIEGIVADAQAGDLRVFPNPAVDVVTVSSSSMIGKVEIVSVDGSLVKTAAIDDTTGKLDVSDVAKGLYLVRTAAGTARLIVK